jgi:hypothetical protein
VPGYDQCVPTGRAGKHFATASNLVQLFEETVMYLAKIAVKRLLSGLTEYVTLIPNVST